MFAPNIPNKSLLENKHKKEEHRDQDSEIEESKATNSNLAS